MAPPITCSCGSCKKCKWRAYMRRWYAKNADRARQSSIQSRQRRLDRVRAYDRQRSKSKQRDPLKERARMVITHLVERGLQRPPCEVCGAAEAEAHHEDYTKPLDVRWLCRKHHMELHRTVAA